MNAVTKVIGAMVVGAGLIIGASEFAVRLLTTNTKTTIEQVEEVVHYQTLIEYDDAQREGIETVKEEGKVGNKTVTYKITRNYLGKELAREIVDTEIHSEAQNEILVIGTKKYYRCSDGTEYDNENARDECDRHAAWEKARGQALSACYADTSKADCWYDEYPGTNIHWTERTYTYTPTPSNNHRTGAICRDGWRSSATGRGACSHHGGVAYWL